jgi:hypothetical protein
MSKESREEANAARKARYEARKAEIKAKHDKNMAEIDERSRARKEGLEANKAETKEKALADKEASRVKQNEDKAKLADLKKRSLAKKALADATKVANKAKHDAMKEEITTEPGFASQNSSPAKAPRIRASWFTVGTLAFAAFLYGITSNGLTSSNSGEGGNQPALEATFYDANTVPFFVGRTAASAAIMLRDRFDESFDNITNVDTAEKVLTYFPDNRNLEDLEGLFVCKQSIAPGADVPDFAFMYISIEVSESCANKKVSFAMGSAAKEIGQFIPKTFEKTCYRPDASECDLPLMDGVVVGFPEEGIRSYKSVLVETGMGVMEVQLALIDLSDEWCDVDGTEGQSTRQRAISERNSLLPIGSFVRLAAPDGLYGNSRFVHRLTPKGTFPDGQPPSSSVNELLVASGYWIPDGDAGTHAWERLFSFSKGLKNAVWKPSNEHLDDSSLKEYRKRILKAANLEFAKPNPILATCLQSKESQVLAIYSEEDDKKRSAYSSVKKESQYWAIWRSVFCPDGGAKNYPQRCKGYNSTIEDDPGMGSGDGLEPEGGPSSDGESTSGGGLVSGGGSNCTWVNAYTRNGSSVRGHWRCR